MLPQLPQLTVIVPCFNEGRFIGPLLESILGQDYPTDNVEIILADGISTDGTRDIVAEYTRRFPQIRCIDNPRRHVPFGLNLAIRQSTGHVIVRMDAHALYPASYLRVLTEALLRSGADNVGGAWDTQPGCDSAEASAIALTTSHPLGIGNASYRLPGQAERWVDTVPFGCFRRELFERIGFFDEQLVRNQDDEFNGRIIRSGGKILLIPSLKIRYFARETLGKLGRMFYQYGLFKPLVNVKLGSPATARQFAPPLLVASVIAGALLAPFSTWILWGWSALIAVYGAAIIASSAQLAWGRGLRVFLYCCLSFPVIHGSYGTGYLAGLLRFVVLRQHRRGVEASVTPSR